MASKLSIATGDKVKVHQILAIVEAMKMEINILARMPGVIESILVAVGQTVKAGELLAVIK